MACIICSKKPYFNSMCRRCFNNYFIKKTRRDIRLNDLFRRNDSVFVNDNKDAQSFAAKWVVENMEMPLKFSRKGKKIVGTSMENEISGFMKSILENKKPGKSREIKLLANMQLGEIYAFAKMKGYKGKEAELDEIQEMVERIEKKHSTTKTALYKSVKALKSL